MKQRIFLFVWLIFIAAFSGNASALGENPDTNTPSNVVLYVILVIAVIGLILAFILPRNKK